MPKLDSIDIDLELTGDAKRLLQMSEVARRFGRLEAALPEAYAALREAKDEDLRGAVHQVFGILFSHLKD